MTDLFAMSLTKQNKSFIPIQIYSWSTTSASRDHFDIHDRAYTIHVYQIKEMAQW